MRANNLKLIFILINYPRFIFHIISFSLSYQKYIIVSDIKRAMELWGYDYGIYTSLVYLLWYDKYFRTLFYQRIGQPAFLLSILAKSAETFILATHMKIGEGMLVIHPFSTIINAQKIGCNFTVRNDVTIGNNDSKLGRESRPIIGDNVTINVNSVVLGNINIGNNVIVGAGTLLLKDVPDNCVVVGNPATIIKQNGEKVNIKL